MRATGWVVLLVTFGLVWGVAGAAFSRDEARTAPDPAEADSEARAARDEDPALKAVVAEMTDIRDIKPPEHYGRAIPWLAVTVAGAVVAALLAFWIWRRRRKTEKIAVSPPPPPPDERALAALAALRKQGGLPDKAVYFELSSILRDYIDGRFQLDTLEMTTEELLPAIRELPTRAELRSALADLFRFADPVKYADGTAGEGRRVSDFGFAETFVRTTSAAPETADV